MTSRRERGVDHIVAQPLLQEHTAQSLRDIVQHVLLDRGIGGNGKALGSLFDRTPKVKTQVRAEQNLYDAQCRAAEREWVLGPCRLEIECEQPDQAVQSIGQANDDPRLGRGQRIAGITWQVVFQDRVRGVTATF